MDVFAHYDILDSNGNRVAEGLKASFCLEDSACNPGVRPKYQCQNYGQQGRIWSTLHSIDNICIVLHSSLDWNYNNKFLVPLIPYTVYMDNFAPFYFTSFRSDLQRIWNLVNNCNIFTLIDRLIDWIGFYVISAILQPYNDSEVYEQIQKIILGENNVHVVYSMIS